LTASDDSALEAGDMSRIVELRQRAEVLPAVIAVAERVVARLRVPWLEACRALIDPHCARLVAIRDDRSAIVERLSAEIAELDQALSVLDSARLPFFLEIGDLSRQLAPPAAPLVRPWVGLGVGGTR